MPRGILRPNSMKIQYKAWRFRISLALLWLLSLFVIPAFGQTQITLRFIDSESGKPLKGIYEGINGGNSDKRDGTTKTIVWQSALKKTDNEGKVIVQLPEPAPRYIFYSADVLQLHGCSSGVFLLEDIVRAGVVAGFNAKKTPWSCTLKAQATAMPGEIIIFDRRLTLWEKIRQEIP